MCQATPTFAPQRLTQQAALLAVLPQGPGRSLTQRSALCIHIPPWRRGVTLASHAQRCCALHVCPCYIACGQCSAMFAYVRPPRCSFGSWLRAWRPGHARDRFCRRIPKCYRWRLPSIVAGMRAHGSGPSACANNSFPNFSLWLPGEANSSSAGR